jgi:hypothetical protein
MRVIADIELDISYWKADVGGLGFAKEAIGSLITGGVPNTGSLRQMGEQEIEQARKRDSSLSSASETIASS